MPEAKSRRRGTAAGKQRRDASRKGKGGKPAEPSLTGQRGGSRDSTLPREPTYGQSSSSGGAMPPEPSLTSDAPPQLPRPATPLPSPRGAAKPVAVKTVKDDDEPSDGPGGPHATAGAVIAAAVPAVPQAGTPAAAQQKKREEDLRDANFRGTQKPPGQVGRQAVSPGPAGGSKPAMMKKLPAQTAASRSQQPSASPRPVGRTVQAQ